MYFRVSIVKQVVKYLWTNEQKQNNKWGLTYGMPKLSDYSARLYEMHTFLYMIRAVYYIVRFCCYIMHVLHYMMLQYHYIIYKYTSMMCCVLYIMHFFLFMITPCNIISFE